MRLTAVEPFAERLVESLSGGERQRVRLAMLVAQDSDCLLLDEPISALDAFTRFSGLVRGHLDPFITALSDYAGVSPRVFWNNAANLFEWMVREIKRRPDVPSVVIADGERIVHSREWPDGWRNRLFPPVRYVSEGKTTLRWRCICCLCHLLPRYEYCSNSIC